MTKAMAGALSAAELLEGELDFFLSQQPLKMGDLQTAAAMM